MAKEAEVLIVGAGPTGLVLALWLNRMGVRLRIIDRAPSPGQTSRALAVHARTLEFYDQFGIADDVVARGLRMEAVGLWVAGRRRGARLKFGDIGRGLSPFPYALVFPQDEHEELLIGRLREEGVEVERPVELIGFESGHDKVEAHLRESDGSEERIRVAFLAGCDGARSRVREKLSSGFPGGTYSHLFYVADVEAAGPVVNGELNVGLDEVDFLAVFPLRGEGRVRLVGDIERPDSDQLGLDDVGHLVIRRLGLEVKRINWFSTYRVHHRVADHWRVGRVFLLGDAAHIHSPVGGQGMNTGIGDAVNLAWKLAHVIEGRADESLLDTFEPERIAFARRLVASTDRAFTFISQNGFIARRVRLNLVPVLAPLAFRIAVMRRLMFLTISQTNVNYRGGALAEGAAGKVHGGDRMPWAGEGQRNFAPLKDFGWHGQVFGDVEAGLEDTCRRLGLALTRFAWDEGVGRARIARDAFHLVRPDGYVALVSQSRSPERLASYQARHRLKFGDPIRPTR